MFPLEKYRYHTNNTDLVIAESTYAGKKYVGKAHCVLSEDKFDLEKGKALAAARCNRKICSQKLKKAVLKKAKLISELERIQNEFEDAKRYFNDMVELYTEALDFECEVEQSLGVKDTLTDMDTVCIK